MADEVSTKGTPSPKERLHKKGMEIPESAAIGFDESPDYVRSGSRSYEHTRTKPASSKSLSGLSMSDTDLKSDTLSEHENDSGEHSKSRSNSRKNSKKRGLFSKDSSDSSSSECSQGGNTTTEIEDKHPEFEVTYDMMLGIRTVIGMAYSHPSKDMTKKDFEFVARYKFPKAGSSKTPAHKARDFRFKDYHPEVFRRIRERFEIDAADYTMTVTNNHYLEFISNSKSGQFFFYTHNKQFMIKTMSRDECRFIRKILPQYYEYVMANQNTLLTRYYGIHRVKPSGSKKIRFLIMGSVFFTDRFIHESFDLKGSTHGRSATDKEKRQEVPVLKDLDFLEKKVKLHLEKSRAEAFVAQVQKDTQFLQKLNIMDYSMLIGIHYLDREAPIQRHERKTGTSVDMTEAARKDVEARRQSHYGLRGQQEIITTRNDYMSSLSLVSEDSSGSSSKKKHSSASPLPKKKNVSVFCDDDGGIRGVNADGSASNVVYYIGIIDILQQYNTKKYLESSIKSISVDANALSAVNPKKYAQRFNKFIADAMNVSLPPDTEYSEAADADD